MPLPWMRRSLLRAREVLASVCPGLCLNESERQEIALAMLTFATTIAAEATAIERERCAGVVEAQRPKTPVFGWTQFAHDRHAILTSAAEAIRNPSGGAGA